ncbi:MAG: hypothetical protein KDB27_27240 [Planctomycetales bacterium]|nr:hypothetical protein [Planctomycetales bacterium]
MNVQNPITSTEDSSESADAANQAFAAYLRRNVRASLELHRLDTSFKYFLAAAPRVFVSKCIDGRVHAGDEKGYPPSTVTYVRTEGTNVDLSPNNNRFWDRLHAVILDAANHTPGCPALFYALGHFGVMGSGCAAHNQDNDRALATVRQQAEELRKRYRPDELFIIHGMTNTDDHSLRLYFADGHELDTARLIERLNTPEMPLADPRHAFQRDFLNQPLDDREANVLIDGQPPGTIMTGPDAPMFHDIRAMVAMESYLINEMRRIIVNRSRNNVVFDPRLLEAVLDVLHSVSGLPTELMAPLAYQTIWNVAYTLHERQRLETLLDEEQRTLSLQHAENMVAYGEGFELEKRNTLVLVKPGRGNDLEALDVARRVIVQHRHRRGEQHHPPLVHVNVEVTGTRETWQAFNVTVLAKLLTMATNVKHVFGDDCRMLTTYSYRRQKRFYPVHVYPDSQAANAEPISSFPTNLTAGLTNEDFTRNELTLREDAFSQTCAKVASHD